MKLKLQSTCCILFNYCFLQTRYLDEVFCDVETMNDVAWKQCFNSTCITGGTPAAEDKWIFICQQGILLQIDL